MLKRYPFYSILFAVFPVLALAAYNIAELSLDVVLRPLAASLLFGLVVFSLSNWLTREWHRAALSTLVILVLFFVYGHLYSLLEDVTLANLSIFRHRTLLPFLLGFGAIILFVIRRKFEKVAGWTVSLNLMAIYLLIYPMVQIISFQVQQRSADRAVQASAVQVADAKNKPDVYYIILDGYGRADVLLHYLNYDNSEFLNALRQRGFYVADCSQSNYAYTDYSLASSLNYDYLDVLNVDHSRVERVAALKHGAMRSFMEVNGYKVVAFPTGWAFTEWTDADYYLGYDRPATTLTEFEILVMNTTPLRIINDYQVLQSANSKPKDLRRLRVFSLLDHLKKLPDKNEQLFVFAHIVVPHFPYTFTPDGGVSNYKVDGATLEDTKAAYVDQVQFVNREVLAVIDILMARSETPPIIVIQGDHGPLADLSFSNREKMPILNAYYLPGLEYAEVLYPSISPVNTFRIIQNEYFGQTLPLLEDRSYYASNENHADSQLVPNTCPYQP